MGGALVLGYATRTPPQRLVGRLAGIISSSPLLRQSKDVRAPALVVRAGSLLGKLSATLTLKATVTPEVSALAFASGPVSRRFLKTNSGFVTLLAAHVSRSCHPEGVRRGPAVQANRDLPRRRRHAPRRAFLLLPLLVIVS